MNEWIDRYFDKRFKAETRCMLDLLHEAHDGYVETQIHISQWQAIAKADRDCAGVWVERMQRTRTRVRILLKGHEAAVDLLQIMSEPNDFFHDHLVGEP